MPIPIRVVERIFVKRTPDKVWPYVIVPELLQKWNNKMVETEARHEFVLGQRFMTHYQMRRRGLRCTSEVTALEPHRRLALRHFDPQGDNVRLDMEATETITLTEKKGGTLLLKEVVIRNHGTPWWIMPLVVLVTLLGKPRNPNPLKKLLEVTP